MTPEHAKKLHRALSDNLAKYEGSYGKIKESEQLGNIPILVGQLHRHSCFNIFFCKGHFRNGLFLFSLGMKYFISIHFIFIFSFGISQSDSVNVNTWNQMSFLEIP